MEGSGFRFENLRFMLEIVFGTHSTRNSWEEIASCVHMTLYDNIVLMHETDHAKVVHVHCYLHSRALQCILCLLAHCSIKALWCACTHHRSISL